MFSVQVNSRTLIKNLLAIKKRLKPKTKFCAVVKSNAYGFGSQRISHLLEPMVDCFAVANVQEGVRLRKGGISKDILVFGATSDYATAIKYDLIITLNSVEEANYLTKQRLFPRLHIAVNTGMNRFGISSVHELRSILQIMTNAKIEGCYTHLAHESDHLVQVEQALARFKKYVYIIKKYYPNAIIHAGCSGVIDYQPAHFDMVRIGKALYGGTQGTQTAFKVTSRIVAVKHLKAGASLGYNSEYTAEKPIKVGVVQGGYAQGIQMSFSGKSFVTVDKTFCKIIGRVCMDCFFIDVSKIGRPLGKTVTIIAPLNGQTLLDVARQTNLIACNIIQGFRNQS